MISTMRNDENTDSTLNFAATSPSYIRPRPVVLFIKVGLVIIFCEAAIEAAAQLSSVSSKWDILLDPILLAVCSTLFLYQFIVSPLSMMLKITKEAEDKLNLFRGLINKSNDAILVIDPATAKLMDVNYKVCVSLDYTQDEFRNMTVMDIDELITNSSVWADYVGKIRNNGYVILGGRYKRKNGTTFPVEVNANIIKWGRRDYMVAVARDITDREFAKTRFKESETKFRKMAECAKDAIIMMGPKGEISFWNSAAEKIFGYSSNEAIGKNLHTLLGPKRFHNAFKKGFAGFQKTGQGNAMGKTLKLAAIRRDGSEFNMELSVAPVQLNGEWHAVGIIRDLSESNQTEADWANQDKAKEITTESIT